LGNKTGDADGTVEASDSGVAVPGAEDAGGDRVGSAVGAAVGALVGAAVGALVGAAVGALVGGAVGVPEST
jgi:hypothetical protein